MQVNAVRRTLVCFIQMCYYVSASFSWSHVGVSEAYDVLFIHGLSPRLLHQRSIIPFSLVTPPTLWFPRVPDYQDCRRLAVVRHDDSYAVIKSSRFGLDITSDDLRVLLAEHTDAP